MMTLLAAGNDFSGLGLGVLIGIGAIVVGYVVSQIAPKQHYPRIAGVLASDAVVGGLTYVGVEPAAYMLVWWVLFSLAFAFEG